MDVAQLGEPVNRDASAADETPAASSSMVARFLVVSMD
jgi:hypothetical protein